MPADVHVEPFFQHCDVRDVEALRVAIAVAADRLGPVTVLVNNAANDVRIPADDITVENDCRVPTVPGWQRVT